jgi:hypothetical protein
MQTRHTTAGQDRVFAAVVKWLRNNALQQCLADGEGCAGRVIKAHSIQSAQIMEYLARDGHVYMFQANNPRQRLSLVGYREATTFTGFCAGHDSGLFREVDFDHASTFDPTSPRQVILLALRAAAHEYWAKCNTQKLYKQLVELGDRKDYELLWSMLNLENADIVHLALALEEFWKPFLLGTKVSTRQIQRLFGSLYQQAQTGRFHLTQRVLFRLPGVPTVAAASVFLPGFDLAGEQLNTLGLESDGTDVVLKVEPDLAHVVLNMLPAESTTWVVFTYHKRHTGCLSPFFSQLRSLDQSALRRVLSKMIVMHCENFVLSPAIVERLPEQVRNLLEEVFNATMYCAQPYDDVPDISLFG